MNLSIAKTLQKLVSLSEINGNEFKNKNFLNKLVEEKILYVKQIGKTQTKITLLDYEALDNYLGNEYNIKDLDYYIKVMSQKQSQRSEIVKASGDTKTKQAATQTGLYISGYDTVTVKINDDDFDINTIPNGTSLFIHQNTKIMINEDILIVGVENVENLLQIKKQKHLFDSFVKNKLFLLLNPTMLNIIGTLKNEYLHFGDFDLAGISIYETKIKAKTKHSNFFIPKNIEKFLQKGNKKLYLKQYDKYKMVKSDDKKIQELITKIHFYQKGVEQEIFIDKEDKND